MSRPKQIIVWTVAAIVAADLALLLSGYRILIKEERGAEYTPYSKYFGAKKVGDTLACTYWTGRSVRTATAGAYDWKPDECPFFVKPAYLSGD